MPILPLETYLHPDDLLSGAPRADGCRWWVLHTRPRAEKALARQCLGLGVPFFLPLCQRVAQVRSRVVTSYVPLFPSYVFLLADEQRRVEALTTNLVVNCLPVADQASLEGDLAGVYRLMASGLPLAPEQQLAPGTAVEITAGPLAGLRGKVIRAGKRFRFVVEVDFLHKGASVEVEGWMLEKVA